MIYRALQPLDAGKKKIKGGNIFPASYLQPKALNTLEKMGIIAPASLPPLKALPKWKIQSTKLAKTGIITAGDFLEAPDKDLAKALKVSEAEIKTYKAEFYAMFNPPDKKN